jgi:hypothetical protein
VNTKELIINELESAIEYYIMSAKSNSLIRFSAYYLLSISGLIAFLLIGTIILGFIALIDPIIAWSGALIMMAIGSAFLPPFGGLFIMSPLIPLFAISGVGLLKRKKWARGTSIGSFVILLLSIISALGRGSNIDDLYYNIFYRSIQVAMLCVSGLGLYSLLINKPVKSYFN